MSTVEKRKSAELWWLTAAFGFGMWFLGGLADFWFVYGGEHRPEQRLSWVAVSLALFLCERIAYTRWRRAAAQWVNEDNWSTNVGGILKIYD